MYDDLKQTRCKVREKIDTITINNGYDISNIIIEALANNGFELDISNINSDSSFGPPKQEISVYRIR